VKTLDISNFNELCTIVFEKSKPCKQFERKGKMFAVYDLLAPLGIF